MFEEIKVKPSLWEKDKEVNNNGTICRLTDLRDSSKWSWLGIEGQAALPRSQCFITAFGPAQVTTEKTDYRYDGCICLAAAADEDRLKLQQEYRVLPCLLQTTSAASVVIPLAHSLVRLLLQLAVMGQDGPLSSPLSILWSM